MKPDDGSTGKVDSVYSVTRKIEFCYGHRLLDYRGKCQHLHGHNGLAVITLRSERLDPRGMVVDFADIKRDISQWIEDHLDHRMLLRDDDPAVPCLQALGEPLYLMRHNPTAENIAREIYNYAKSRGFPVFEVQLWETSKCYATYAPAT